MGAVLRWRRNRTGRPLSPPQIHQKIIWMLSNFHKTTSECWQRTPGTQKGSPFSSKGGRTKYKGQKGRQELGTETRPGEVAWRRNFQTVRNSLTGGSVGSFGISEGNITGREKQKKKKNTDYASNHISQQRSSPDACLPPASKGWTGRCGLHCLG